MRYDLNATMAGRPGGIDPGPYLAVLAVLAPRLPAGARAFAADPEHYDFTSGHCVKDLTISRVQFWTSDRQVILDEILPHDHGCSHEIACWSGSLTVVCRDLTATWIPALCPEKPAEPASG
jgi:hypothetical protein